MMKSVWFAVILIVVFIVPTKALQYEGDSCVVDKSGASGQCTIIEKCQFAIDLLKSNGKPQTCGFNKNIPIVCCPQTSKYGDKAIEKCKEFQLREKDEPKFIFNGEKAASREFPHMAILGYGDDQNIQWLCGGSLISNDFVLTAAHCIFSKEFGLVQYIRLGDLDIKNTTDEAEPQNFLINEHFIHPDYQPPSHYHDLALIKLDRPVKISHFVKPACLYTRKEITGIIGSLVATGWGKTDFLGESSSHLLKVDLNQIAEIQCKAIYSSVSSRKLANGIVDDLMVCAGSPEGKDTCPGDSGGPLHFKSFEISVHYKIVGITSFGKACGIADSAGVYTRVSNYIPWIENIVWRGLQTDGIYRDT